jgi:recombinase
VSKETEKVRRWRERMKAEGKQGISLWLNRDTAERLNTLAAEAKITVSEFIERAVTVTQPKVTDTVTDTSAKVTDTVAVIRELVREEVERALYQVPKPRVTVTKPKVTDAVTDTKVVVTDTTAKVTDTVTDTTRLDRARTAEELANVAVALHQQGLSYEQIARRWDTEGIPTLKGGQWHKGTIHKLIQRHQRR